MDRMEQHPRKAQKKLNRAPKGSLRVNTTIVSEEYAQLYSELKRRGLIRNLPDMLLRSLELLRQSVLESDLKRMRLRALRKSIDASGPEEEGENP